MNIIKLFTGDDIKQYQVFVNEEELSKMVSGLISKTVAHRSRADDKRRNATQGDRDISNEVADDYLHLYLEASNQLDAVK